MRPRFSTHISRTCGGTENPRFLRKFQICGLITLLLDIGSLARGAKIHSHPQILTKKWPKKGGFWGFLGGVQMGGSKGGGSGGGGLPRDPPFCGSNPYRKPRFSPKGPFSGIFAIFGHFGHFGHFWGFLGVFGGFRGVSESGQKWSKRGVFGGGRKRGQNQVFRGFPDYFSVFFGLLKMPFLGISGNFNISKFNLIIIFI